VHNMMFLRRVMFVSLAFLGLSVSALPAAQAQKVLAERQPGLWELRLVEGTSLANMALQAEQLLKNMPPAQRQQMEKLLGAKALPLASVMRYCVTPDMTRTDLRSELIKHDVECSELEWQEGGGQGRYSFVCSHPDGDWTGEGRLSNATAKHLRAETRVQGKYRGQRLAMEMTHEAKWLGDDCKDVKLLD